MSKAIFLDRDGVINEDHGYTYKIKDFKLLDGVVEGLQTISKLEYKIIIITNQSGIARGFFSEDEFQLFMHHLLKALGKHNIHIVDYFFCPHHSDGIIPLYSHKCICRKPEAGMLYEAQKKYNLDLTKSILIGDKESDVLAGKRAGLHTNILIGDSLLSQKSQATIVTSDLIEASKIISKFHLNNS